MVIFFNYLETQKKEERIQALFYAMRYTTTKI